MVDGEKVLVTTAFEKINEAKRLYADGLDEGSGGKEGEFEERRRGFIYPSLGTDPTRRERILSKRESKKT